MSFITTSSTKEFRVSCLTNNGKRIEDMDEDSCRKAVKQCLEGELGVRPTTAILAMSVEKGVELFTTDCKWMTNFTLSEIAFCFVSKEHPDIFSFIARRGEDILCNAFKCLNGKEAGMLYKEMSSTFRLACERDKYENQQKQSRINVYEGEISFLGWKRKGKPKLKDTYGEWDEDPEEEELMRCQ